MALSDVQLRSAKPREKDYKLFDDKGLYVLVTKAGAKLWRFKYAFGGKEKLLSMGTYPATSLAGARKKRDSARALLEADPPVDPSAQRKAEKAAATDSFREVAAEWLAKQNYADVTRDKATWIIETLLAPLAEDSIRTIGAKRLLGVLQKIEARGKRESAGRAKQKFSQIARYAVATGRADRDVSTDLRSALAPVETKSHAAETDPKKFAEILRLIDGYHGQPVTRQYLRILPRVATRPGELRMARWSEVDLEGARLVIPAERMKMRREFVALLSRQVVTLFEELRELSEGKEFCFPGLRSNRPISDAVPSLALKALGIDSDRQTAHGFRTTFSSVLHERRCDSAVIELCLAHQDANKVRAIYNRSERLDDRRKLMQAWSDYCDELAGAKS